MNEFVTFAFKGIVESFGPNFKERAYYISKIVYYSLAIFFAIAVIHEVILHFYDTGGGTSIVDIMDDPFGKKTLYFVLLQLVITPIYFACTFSLCMTRFNFIKVCTSVAIIVASLVCMITYGYKIFPPVKGYYVYDVLLFFILIALTWLIIDNVLNRKQILKIKRFWNNNILKVTYLYVIISSLFCLYFIEWNIINAVATLLSAFYLALMLIYVRRLLGINWSIALHYILISPTIGIVIYMIFNN